MRVWTVLAVALACTSTGCDSAQCGTGLVALDGRCQNEPQCSVACTGNQVCTRATTPESCVCAPGFSGAPCEWDGSVVGDPGLQGLTDELGVPFWRTDEGGDLAEVVPDGEGSIDPGEGRIAGRPACNAASLSQLIDMPPYREDAQLLVAEITYRAQAVNGVEVGFNRAWRHLPPTLGEWLPATFCLGEAAYGDDPSGGPVELQISVSERDANCSGEAPNGSIQIDHFEIRRAEADECPRPGEVVNGEADENGLDWSFALPDESVDGDLVDPLFGRAPGVAEITREAGSDTLAAMSTRVSVPLPTEEQFPALRYSWFGTSGEPFQVQIGTFTLPGEVLRSVEQLRGNNAWNDVAYCLPPWTHGSVVDLSFSFVEESPSDLTLQVDDVEVDMVDDCDASRDLLDPGFESRIARWMGVYSSGGEFQEASVQRDGALVRSGNGVFELKYWNTEPDIRMENFVFVPPSVGDEGPQLIFHFDLPEDPETDVQWVLGKAPDEGGPLSPGARWEPKKVCLLPEWSNRWYRFQVRVGSPLGGGFVSETKRVFLDDFELTTSADCRAANP